MCAFSIPTAAKRRCQVMEPDVPRLISITRNSGRQKSFAQIVGEAFAGELDAQERELLKAAETEFAKLGELPIDCRPYSAYEVGLNGLPRYCGDFTVPSHRAFAWYNGWRIGNDDRRWREAKKARLVKA